MLISGSMSECAVCYVADAKFLFPTIASAMSLRVFVPKTDVDVLIFLTSDPATIHPDLAPMLSDIGVTLVHLNAQGLKRVDAAKWSQGHVSLATLGRFLIADIVAQSYRRLLYVDGDTYFNDDPSELLAYDIPEGKIGAVSDIRAYATSDFGRFGTESRRYFSMLGMTPGQRYFNAGVFVARTDTWREMADEALAYFLENTAICVRHDQSAMNAVLGRRRIPLPIRWNFMTEYENLGMGRSVRPAIYHFTGQSKPWVGPLSPWKRFDPYYTRIEEQIGGIVPRPTWPAQRLAEENRIATRRYWKMHLAFAPRVLAKRGAIKRADRIATQMFERSAERSTVDPR